MVKSLGSVVVILTAWWIVLITGLSCEWMCNIEIATLFLTLVSDITMEEWGSEDTLIVMLSRLQRWFLISWVQEWKEEKKSISLFPRENFSLKGENKKRNSLCDAFTLTLCITGKDLFYYYVLYSYIFIRLTCYNHIVYYILI